MLHADSHPICIRTVFSPTAFILPVSPFLIDAGGLTAPDPHMLSIHSSVVGSLTWDLVAYAYMRRRTIHLLPIQVCFQIWMVLSTAIVNNHLSSCLPQGRAYLISC
jgi:hypothetical protein